MAMTSLSIVLTVFVLQLHHVGPNQKPVPRWLKRSMVDVIAHLLCMSNYVENFYSNSRRHTRNVTQQRQHKRRRNNGHQRPLQQEQQQEQQQNNAVTSSQYSNLLTSSSADQLQDIVSNSQAPAVSRQHRKCNGDVTHGSIPLLTLNTLELDPELASDPNPLNFRRRASRARDEEVGEGVSNQLRIMVSKREGEDEHEDIVNEWRLVAHICDRLLFWIFLVGTVASTLSILVIMPMLKPPIEEL